MVKQKKYNIIANILFLIAAMIWGFAFVAQDVAGEKLGPLTINGIRSLVGSAAVYLIVLFRKIKNKQKPVAEKEKKLSKKTLLISSALCGISFALAYNFQQLGINAYPDGVSAAGRAGFLTGLYVIFVPIIGFIFLKKKVSINVIISVILAGVGLYFLCFGDGIKGIYIGDFIVLISAIFFAIQIIIVDKYNGQVEVFNFIALQLLICGLICMVLGLIIEKPTLSNIISVIIPLLYLGIFSNAAADTCQIVGQKICGNPTVASIIMSLESVFAVLGGLIILGDVPEIKEIIGCVIMFIAIVLSQVNITKKPKTLSE